MQAALALVTVAFGVHSVVVFGLLNSAASNRDPSDGRFRNFMRALDLAKWVIWAVLVVAFGLARSPWLV